MSTPTSTPIWRTGQSLYLRPIEEGDLPHFQRWINDPANSYFLHVTQPMGLVAEQTWYQQVTSGNPDKITVAICLHDGTLIGNTGMTIDPTSRSAVTGTLIGPAAYQGQGYGTDAKMLMLEYAFNWRDVRKVTSKVLANNQRSQRYATRCGYRLMARIEQEHFRHGAWIDELQFVVFAHEWYPLWEHYKRQRHQP